MTRLFLLVSLLLNLFLGFYLFRSHSPTTAKTYQVLRVLDGDTFEIDNHQQIRLMSVNAPEINLCGGQEAKSALENLLQGRQVRLVSDGNDHFGRLLALVYTGDTLVNEQIILSGWARFTSTASPESERLKAAFQKIKQQKIGVYSPKCYQSENPKNPQCSIKGNVKDGIKTYFFKGCGNYSNVALELDQGDSWFCSESEANSAGFTKAKNCYDKQFTP